MSSIASNLDDIPFLSKFIDSGSTDREIFTKTRILITYLSQKAGFHFVLDTTWCRDVVLKEEINAFCDRFNANSNTELPLPLFSSSCPGWICYAEKTNGNFSDVAGHEPNAFSLVKHLSPVRSPQQTVGFILKQVIADVSAGDIYHVAIMPCFDKKLEASRSEFSCTLPDGSTSEPDVDLVLSTKEFVDFLNVINDDGKLLTTQPPKLIATLEEVSARLKDQRLGIFR
ncbi:unnamed protein product, partial [Protopolystoma xenopodis]